MMCCCVVFIGLLPTPTYHIVFTSTYAYISYHMVHYDTIDTSINFALPCGLYCTITYLRSTYSTCNCVAFASSAGRSKHIVGRYRTVPTITTGNEPHTGRVPCGMHEPCGATAGGGAMRHLLHFAFPRRLPRIHLCKNPHKYIPD